MAILGILLMIAMFVMLFNVAKFLWNAIQLVMKYDTFYAVILYMQENKWALVCGILLIIIVIAVIYEKITDIPIDRRLNEQEKEMDFADHYGCKWPIRSLSELPDGNKNSDDKYLWFDSNDNYKNFSGHHVNKIAYRIVWREDQWMVQPIELTYTDETKDSYHVHYVSNYYEIPGNVKTIYDIDGIYPPSEVNTNNTVVVNQTQIGGSNNVQIGIVNNIERKDDNDD